MAAPTPLPPKYDLVKLREIIARSDYADLRIFCDDLGEDYNAIVGEGKTMREAALAVIKFFDNRGRITDLVRRVRQEFPSAEWATVTGETLDAQPNVYVETGGGQARASGGAADVYIKAERASGPLRIFLCHASPDKPIVTELYDRLLAAGFDPWLDRKKIRFGQDWRQAIRQAIENSDLILVCLSNRSLKRDGYLQQEIEDVLNIADRQPTGKIFVIPLRLEECEVPERIARWHWANYFDEADRAQLFVDLNDHGTDRKIPLAAATPRIVPKPPKPTTDPLLIDLPTLKFGLQLVHIPAGPFFMGSDKTKDSQAYDQELPQHSLTLGDYYIGKYKVTNTQFLAFVQATGHKTTAEKEGSGFVWTGTEWKDTKGADWRHPRGPDTNIDQKAQHPVVQVSWHDAMAFCDWLSKVSGRKVTLPSEPEWEKAARGTDGRIYPWGNGAPTKDLLNFNSNVGDTTPVGQYSPKGDSPYGVADMAGNAWDWTRSLWGKDVNTPEFKYPYVAGDGREDLNAGEDVHRVVRGGSWNFGVRHMRAALRVGNVPTDRNANRGLRVVLSAPV